MEKLQDPFLAERIRKGGSRSTCGFVDRPARSAAATMDDYSEIFGGFASSCSIPVLVLPEAMDGYGEALLQSHSMNYLEIFGDLDTGTFPVYHEQLLSVGKGSKEGDDRFEEVPNGSLFEKGVFEMHLDVPTRDHIKISKVNKKSSTFHSSLNTEQLNISSRTGQKGIIDEVNSTICSSGLQANCGPDLEADTASSTGIVEDDENPKTIESDDHILNGSMEEEEEKRGKKEEFLSTCYVGSPVHGSENDFKLSKYSSLESKAEDLKQHSRSSSYHSTSSGDVPFSDYSFLTISDINLHTQPLQVPPPSRAPPKLDMKQEMPKSEEFEASNTTFSDELIPDTYKVYHGHHVGVPRTRHALKETTKCNSPIYLNVEVDASSAAAASAAAIVEAMEQAQASLKSAKELMERNRESPQSGRKDSHCFGSWNEQNISFAGRLRYRTPKLAQKVVLNQVERADPIFSEHAEGAIHGKESKFSLLSDERERFHEWKIDKQFYELVGSEKLMRTRVINGEKYTRDEATPNAYPFFPHKETYGAHTKMNSHSDNDNKMEMLHKYKSEKKLYPGGELEVQDRNAENLKFGNTVENEEILDILETSDIQSVNGDDEDKQKIGTVTQVLDESEIKAEGGISLIKHNRNVKELKASQESRIYEAGEKNEDDNKEINSRGRNDSGLMDFYSDSKLEGFDSEAVGKTLGHGKEFDEILGTSITSDHDALTSNEHMVHTSNVFNYNATSEFKKFLVKLSSLENANEEGVEKECRKSFSSGKEKNLDEMREEGQLGKLNKTIRETVVVGYNDGKYSELKDIVDTSEKEVNGKFSETNKSNEFEKNERKLKHEQNTKLNAPNRSEAKVGKASVRPDFLANAKDEFKLQQNEEEKKQYELPPKFVNFVDKLTDDDEKRKGDRHLVGKVQAAFELEKKIRRLSTDQQGLQRIRVQDAEAVQQAKSLSASVNASGSSLKQMEKSIPDEWRDANYISKELSDRERKEAEQKRKLDEERDREREKDRIAVEKTSESCEKIFPESRERPLRSEKSAEVFERFEKVPDEAKLLAERAAVERATAEARERAIEKALAEQASLGARRQAETLTNVSKEKNMKHNTSEGIVRPGEDCESVYDAPADANSQSAGLKEESPLRCKARKERHQRMVERAAKALAEKNMRDLLAQKEQAERNRLAESLDAEVKRWSNGKEGNLRALLSTLQYILGHDSGWQPIPLTDVITAAAVRKAYRKATLYVHPDKLQQRGAIIQHKYICEKVFDLLKDAWNRFNSEGR